MGQSHTNPNAAVQARAAGLAAISAYLDKAPGPLTITISAADGRQLLRLELPANPRPAHLNNDCKLAIYQVLEESNHRMTTDQILSALDRRHAEGGLPRNWSDSWVKAQLSEMIESGVINNDQKARPRGYGLAEGE